MLGQQLDVRERAMLALLLFCFVADDPAAAPEHTPTQDERRFVEGLIRVRNDEISELRPQLRKCILALEKARSAISHAPPHTTRKEREAAVREAEAACQACKSKIAPISSGDAVPEAPFVTPEIGILAGRMGGDFRVLNIIGPDEMLVTFGSGNAMGTWWLSGFSTANLVDDQRIQLNRFHRFAAVDGTKSYTSVVGKRLTVTCIRAITVDEKVVRAEYLAWCKKHPVLLPVTAQAPQKPTPATPMDPETAARKKFAGVLSNARNLAAAGLKERAAENLNRIIREAPGTSVAKDAQKELDSLH
jgi:hypothetical protein